MKKYVFLYFRSERWERRQLCACRFRAYRKNYVLMLDVEKANMTDTGVYVCAQPALYSAMGELGLIGIVGVVRQYTSLAHSHARF